MKVYRLEINEGDNNWKGYFRAYSNSFYSLLHKNKDFEYYDDIKRELSAIHDVPPFDFPVSVKYDENKFFAFTEKAMSGDIGNVIYTRLIYFLEKYPGWIRLRHFNVSDYYMSFSKLQIIYERGDVR